MLFCEIQSHLSAFAQRTLNGSFESLSHRTEVKAPGLRLGQRVVPRLVMGLLDIVLGTFEGFVYELFSHNHGFLCLSEFLLDLGDLRTGLNARLVLDLCEGRLLLRLSAL